MARDDVQLTQAKRAYKHASAEGNRQEEARWANTIGDILKKRGEYVEALKWLRIDYEISVKYLPEKQLLPTCQSLGEVYLRLEHFEDALVYQKKHLELAKDVDDLVEQQRASTQLGRTYHEMFLRSEDDIYSRRNAKKYFTAAMKFVRILKENPSSKYSSSFLKEYIDAHNNLGMLEMDLDNFEEAEKILLEGLKICDEEEVAEDDDARSRLHHNLGNLYTELRMWDKAREHIEKDIIICQRIEHYQGEAKGYINLGGLHYRLQKYAEANMSYQKALEKAKSMEDEDALVEQISQNIEIVKEAIRVMNDMKSEEQNLKKLSRTMTTARGTPRERKCLLEQNACLDRLIEKARTILAWLKHREFAKRKKRVAGELCDKEKLGDSFLAIGESYQKLRNFSKALKWYMKSLDAYQSIGNLEGQALAKINIGDILDSSGDWTGAQKAFEEGYRIAVQANLPSVQISALENIHYSHMIRFDNIEEARRLQLKIDNLKNTTKIEEKNVEDCCSETETEGDDGSTEARSHACNSPKISESNSKRSKPVTMVEEFNDDVPLISLLQSTKNVSRMNKAELKKTGVSMELNEALPKGLIRPIGSQEPAVGRKRVRVVLSDDESDEHNETQYSRGRHNNCVVEDYATSYKSKETDALNGSVRDFQDFSRHIPSKDVLSVCTPVNLDASTCSNRSQTHEVVALNSTGLRSLPAEEVADASNIAVSSSKNDYHDSDNLTQKQSGADLHIHCSNDGYGRKIIFKIDGQMVHVDAHSWIEGNVPSIECLKVEVACLYYLQLPEEKRARGLLPVIRHMKHGSKILESLDPDETYKDHILAKGWIEVAIDGWVHKRLMKLYIDCCNKLSEAINMKLLKKLYNLEVSDDEVIASDCEMQDITVAPLIDALCEQKTIAMLDLSHNLLGNETMEKLKQIFMSSDQKYGGLTLDLHCNRFGPTALFQICECPVLIARLEVLDISGNRLTDSCASYISTILKNCKALYSLNIEHCSITSRTIQKVADALDAESVLVQFSIGNNNPICGNAMVNLLAKLAGLKRFSELNLNGIKLSKAAVDSLCQLAKTSCLSGLMLGGTSMGAEGALQLTEALLGGSQELMKLDLSYCGLKSHNFIRFCLDFTSISSIVELNLGGNSPGPEGADALVSLLTNPECCLKVLVLNKCHLGLVGVLQIIEALAENGYLEELNLAENADLDKASTLEYDVTALGTSKSVEPVLNVADISAKISAPDEVVQQSSSAVKADSNNLEVDDSEDGPIRQDPILSGCDDSCTSSCPKNPPFVDCEFVQDLTKAIGMAKQLQILDLRNNGFPVQVAETLYSVWSSSRCSGSASRHIKNETVHFSVEGKHCCRVKDCCRRD
ncbi:protein TONSOKU [Macadamia integrifolia]|uniref:protein TONSOKU n=1 Tax=Macadamia integrifolia TaxID=60698 RepID=UPI001C4FB9C9|nr:protein TONSOKU [Macadamia integrifolia]